MKIFKKIVAAIASIIMAAMLPMPSMAAPIGSHSAVYFTVDKTFVQEGDTVKLSVNVDQVPADGWNILDFSITYDASQLEPVKSKTGSGKEYEWSPGAAMDLLDQQTIVNLALNPILGGSISIDGQTQNGEYMSVLFKVKKGVRYGEALTIIGTVNQFAQAVIIDEKAQMPIDLIQPHLSQVINLTVRPAEWESTVTFTTDKTSAEPGDTIKLSINIDQVPADGWNILDFSITYDASQLEPIMTKTGSGKEHEWSPGAAMDLLDQQTIVNLALNPILGGSISINGQTQNGEYMCILFKVKEGVRYGDTLTIRGTVNQLAQSIIIDGYAQSPKDLVQPQSSQDMELKVQPNALESLEISKPANKLVYLEGQTLDLTGLEVTAHYSSNTPALVAVTTDMITGFDSTVVGDQIVTITYQGKKVTYGVKVICLGDINQDGMVDAIDALQTLQAATNKIVLEGIKMEAANVDGKDSITANDALMILQYYTSKISGFKARAN